MSEKSPAPSVLLSFKPFEPGQTGVIYDWPDGSFSGHIAGDAEAMREMFLMRRLQRRRDHGAA